MLDRPALTDERLTGCVMSAYGLSVKHIAFLPIGADPNTAVYRLIAADDRPYFLKLRRGAFAETSVTLPKFLSEQGLAAIIAPLTTRRGGLWVELDDYRLILYPFVEGRDGYQVTLSDQHWLDFGATLQRIHTLNLPLTLSQQIRSETYAPHWRDSVKCFLERAAFENFADPLAAQLAASLILKRDELRALIERTEHLAQALRANPPHVVLCHSDLHAGNLLIGHDGAVHIVDWDDAILAPKERDLMYAGGGQFGSDRTPAEEERLFYRGYGSAPIDPLALTYYRYERIIEDIAVECEQIFSNTVGPDDRAQEYEFFLSNFRPNGVLAIAREADRVGAI